MFSFFGAAGVMFVTSVGGRIFVVIDPSSTFVMIGLINTLLFIAAMVVSRLHGERDLAETTT